MTLRHSSQSDVIHLLISDFGLMDDEALIQYSNHDTDNGYSFRDHYVPLGLRTLRTQIVYKIRFAFILGMDRTVYFEQV